MADLLEIEETFNIFDVNGDGKIDFDELKQVLTGLGESVTDQDVKNMITEADLNGDGCIDFNEFVVMIKKNEAQTNKALGLQLQPKKSKSFTSSQPEGYSPYSVEQQRKQSKDQEAYPNPMTIHNINPAGGLKLGRSHPIESTNSRNVKHKYMARKYRSNSSVMPEPGQYIPQPTAKMTDSRSAPVDMGIILPSLDSDSSDHSDFVIDEKMEAEYTASPNSLTRRLSLRDIPSVLVTRQMKDAKKSMKAGWIQQELLDTEETYLKGLHVLLDEFIMPVFDQKLVNQSYKKQIVCNIPQMIAFHTQFLEKLRIGPIAKVFNEQAAFFRMYVQYLSEYNNIVDLFAKLKKNKKFESFLNKKMNNENKNLINYAILPIQRIPRYLLLLEELLKKTPKEKVYEHQCIENALKKVRRICTEINEKQGEIENMSQSIWVMNKLKGFGINIVRPDRKYIGHFVFKKVINHNLRQFFAFTDIIIVADAKWHVKQVVKLKKFQVFAPSEDNDVTVQITVDNKNILTLPDSDIGTVKYVTAKDEINVNDFVKPNEVTNIHSFHKTIQEMKHKTGISRIMDFAALLDEEELRLKYGDTLNESESDEKFEGSFQSRIDSLRVLRAPTSVGYTPDTEEWSRSYSIKVFRSKTLTKSSGNTTATVHEAQMEASAIKIEEEIIGTEKQYLEGLHVLMDEFLTPIFEKKLLNQGNKKQVFWNIPEMISCHEIFLKRLERGPIGTVFAEKSDFLRMYIQFATEYQKILNVFNYTLIYNSNSKVKKNWKLDAFLKKKRKKEGKALISYLILPIQRVPTYNTLLTKLLTTTSKGKVTEYAMIESALNKVKTIENEIIKKQKEIENVSQCMLIGSKLKGLKTNIVQADRTFIQHFVFKRKLNKKNKQFILFSDIIIIADSKWKTEQIVKLNNFETDLNGFEKKKEVIFTIINEDIDYKNKKKFENGPITYLKAKDVPNKDDHENVSNIRLFCQVLDKCKSILIQADKDAESTVNTSNTNVY